MQLNEPIRDGYTLRHSIHNIIIIIIKFLVKLL